jgi:hypothetical protein
MAKGLVGTFQIAGQGGGVTGEMHRWMQGQQRQAAELSSGKASVNQTWEQSWLIEFADNKDYRVVINSALARTITGVTTRSSAGTCTLTVKVNTTALGGTANSVSTSEQTQSHSSANAVAVGDDIVLTVSSNSGAENVSVTLTGTLTLA